MSEYVLGLQAMASAENPAETLASGWTSVCCACSWTSIAC